MPEIELVAAHFQETAAKVLRPMLLDGFEPAQLLLGRRSVPCEIRAERQERAPPFACAFVAQGEPGNRVVVASATVRTPAHEVLELMVSEDCPGKTPATPR